MFLEEARMRRAHEASNQILKDELVKVYKKMDQERQARIQGESVMKLLTDRQNFHHGYLGVNPWTVMGAKARAIQAGASQNHLLMIHDLRWTRRQ